MNWFKSIFKHPTYEQQAQRDLEQARWQLLQAQGEAEHAQATVSMLRTRVQRLEALERQQ